VKRKTIEKVQSLEQMTVGELRLTYQEVFGESTRSYNKDYLRRRIAWRLQELDEGGLSERARKRAEELAKNAEVRTRPPVSAGKNKTSSGQNVVVDFPRSNKLMDIAPGTTLRREYKNQLIVVTAMENGFLYNGQVYRSLSAIAKEVTGSMWNGRLFFGLTKHSREKNVKKEE